MSPEVLPVASAPDVLPNTIAEPDPKLPKVEPDLEDTRVPPVLPAMFIATLLGIFRHSQSSSHALFAS